MGNLRNEQKEYSSESFVRWGMFAVGSGLVALSLLLKWQPSLLPSGTDAVMDLTARVGLICLASWLAWPVFVAVKKAPGGAILIIGIFFTAFMFIVRKQSIYILGPYMAIAIVAAMILGWLRKQRK